MGGKFAAVLLAVTAAAISGCGGDSTVVSPPIVPPTSTVFQGVVMAGGSAASSASVQLYAAGTSGYATPATALLTSAVTTNSSGAFTIDGDYTCPSSSSQLYLVAQGTGTHTSMTFLSAIGSCNSITSNESFMVNEVTTAAFAWALAPFMSGVTAVSASSTNATGLANAFLTAQLLADSVTGNSPASAVVAGVTLESAKVYSLANALAPCASTTSCTTLFAAATYGSSTPTNTAAAALAIVKNPSSNVSAVYLAGATGPFAGLGVAPADWTMTISSTGGGMGQARTVSVDSTGRAWVASYPGSLNVFTPQGTPVFSTPLTTSSLSESIGLTVDPSDNVWITSGLNDSIMEFSKSGTLLSPVAGYAVGGIRYPVAAASDVAGNIWVVNNGNGSVTKLSNAGVPAQSTGYAAGGALQFGVTIAIDSNATPWIATENGLSVHLTSAGVLTLSSSCCAIPNGIAVDGSNGVWVADQYGSAIVHVAPSTGAIVSMTANGGVKNPSGIAVDSAGNVWASNSFTGTLSEVNSSGVAISPNTGLGVDTHMSQPEGLAIDASGNIWVVSNADDRLVRFVGLASPIQTPLLAGPKLP